MDPHSFSLLDADPHSICRSGFRRNHFEEKNRKKLKEIGTANIFIIIIIILLSKLGPTQ